jgi:membrane protease YdiL (CAAX protease family)
MAAVLLMLWAVQRDRRVFFLARGDLAAPLEPVRWLGIGAGEKWSSFGWIVGALPLGRLSQAAPLLWTIVLFPAMNAIGEELTPRLPLLATTHEGIGKQHALWLTAVYFGLAHVLHGDPSGLIGFAVIALPVYLLGKSLLETRGALWAIVMHFLGDIPLFAMYALSAT